MATGGVGCHVDFFFGGSDFFGEFLLGIDTVASKYVPTIIRSRPLNHVRFLLWEREGEERSKRGRAVSYSTSCG